MASMSMDKPAGIPSRITMRARPCDSPAVRKRTIRCAIVYEVSAAPAERPEQFPNGMRTFHLGDRLAASRRHAAVACRPVRAVRVTLGRPCKRRARSDPGGVPGVRERADGLEQPVCRA